MDDVLSYTFIQSLDSSRYLSISSCTIIINILSSSLSCIIQAFSYVRGSRRSFIFIITGLSILNSSLKWLISLNRGVSSLNGSTQCMNTRNCCFCFKSSLSSLQLSAYFCIHLRIKQACSLSNQWCCYRIQSLTLATNILQSEVIPDSPVTPRTIHIRRTSLLTYTDTKRTTLY